MPRRGARARKGFPAWDGDEATVDAARAAECDDPQSRIEFIAEVMARGQYIHFRTRRELARVWTDIGPDRLSQLITQAATLVRASLGNHKDLQVEALNTMQLVRQQCLHHGEEAYEAGSDFAFKWFEIAGQMAQGMLAWTDSRFDRALAQRRERRDAEKHAREMGAVAVREVTLVVEESTAAPKDDGGNSGLGEA